jgi:hypothetical protein
VAQRRGAVQNGAVWRTLQRHEAFVVKALGEAHEAHEAGYWRELRDFHLRQLAFMQHERLIHLLVFLTVCVVWLLGIAYVTWQPSLWGFGLVGLLLALVAAYMVHYFRLENGVQRWYHLANRLDERCGLVSGPYDEGG